MAVSMPVTVKASQPDGVKNIHDPFVDYNVRAGKNMLVKTDDKKKNQHGNKGHDHIDRVDEQAGRHPSKKNVSEHTAADGGCFPQDDHSQKIQTLSDRSHSTGGGKGNSADSSMRKKREIVSMAAPRFSLQKIDLMLAAYSPHISRPDTGLYFSDVGTVKQKHTQTGLSDTASDGVGKFSV